MRETATITSDGFKNQITWLTSTTRWSWSCWIIKSQTVVFPDAAPPATPASQYRKISRMSKEIKMYLNMLHSTCRWQKVVYEHHQLLWLLVVPQLNLLLSSHPNEIQKSEHQTKPLSNPPLTWNPYAET